MIELDGRAVAAARRLMRPADVHLGVCELCASVVHRMAPPGQLCPTGQALLGRLADQFTADEIWMAYATLDCDERSETASGGST